MLRSTSVPLLTRRFALSSLICWWQPLEVDRLCWVDEDLPAMWSASYRPLTLQPSIDDVRPRSRIWPVRFGMSIFGCRRSRDRFAGRQVFHRPRWILPGDDCHRSTTTKRELHLKRKGKKKKSIKNSYPQKFKMRKLEKERNLIEIDLLFETSSASADSRDVESSDVSIRIALVFCKEFRSIGFRTFRTFHCLTLCTILKNLSCSVLFRRWIVSADEVAYFLCQERPLLMDPTLRSDEQMDEQFGSSLLRELKRKRKIKPG